MKRITYSRGKYSTIELVDKSRFFLEALPDAVTVRKMRLKLVPSGRINWQFRFPFYIRTAVESWELSEEILEMILLCLEDCDCGTEDELLTELNEGMAYMLQGWIKANHDRATTLGLNKLGKHFRLPPNAEAKP